MWSGPNRKSPRLKGFDYASNAAFFVTICTHGREHLFGEIVNGEMVLNKAGDIVFWEWYKSEEMRQEVTLDAFVIMPNHIHSIVLIQNSAPQPANHIADPVGTTGPLSLRATQRKPGGGKRSLSSMMGAFKLVSAIKINNLRGTPKAPVWQGRFHDQIIRGEAHLSNVRQYIECNPANWAGDEENL